MHKCSKNVNPNAKSTFNTKYMMDQQSVEKMQKDLVNVKTDNKKNQKSSSKTDLVSYKVMMLPLKPDQKFYRPNTAKMDFVTTNQVEYQKRVPTPEVTRVGSAEPYKKDIAKITAYAADYPDWGPVVVSREKTWHPPVRSVDLTFSAYSSYKDKFQSPDPLQVDMYKTNYSTLGAFQSKFSLAPKEKMTSQTTYNEKMSSPMQNLNSRVIVRPSPATPTPATCSHFTTTFQDSFKPSSPGSKDPRRMRYGLMEKRRRSDSVK
jgi:hypothetical protein